MQRYFVDISSNSIVFNDDDIFHITKVMRLKSGNNIQIVDKSTHLSYLAYISSVSPLKVEIQEPIKDNSELNKDVTLFFALAKADKMELVIQKATELGVKNIVLFQGERSVVKFTKEDFNRKLNRFNSIAKEASEQCHRTYIPNIYYVNHISLIKDYLADKNFFAYELEAGQTTDLVNYIKPNDKSLSVIIGPEGGFSNKEADYLKENEFIPISLGNRILRCETAAIYACSVLAYNLEK